jgi:hypothetical protein
MNESILQSIKKLLGIDASYTEFDQDIIMHINSVFMILRQMGVGPDSGYKIDSASNQWSEFTNDDLFIESVKTYIYLKVRMYFDPPQNTSLISAIQSQISELEWRLNVASLETRVNEVTSSEDNPSLTSNFLD